MRMCRIYGLVTALCYTAPMTGVSSLLSIAGSAAFAAHVINEIRGAALAVPVLWAMYESGGTWMAIWIGICSLAGIALSIFAPWFAYRFAKRRWSHKLAF
jgi:hypothetical protein